MSRSSSNASNLDIRSLVAKLDPVCRGVLSDAADLAYRRQHGVLDLEHVLAVCCVRNDDAWTSRCVEAGFDLKACERQLESMLGRFVSSAGLPPALSDRLVDVMRDAWVAASLQPAGLAGGHAVDLGALLRAMAQHRSVVAELQREAAALARLASTPAQPNASEDAGESSDGTFYSALSRFTVDLTAQAARGEIDPVIGRDGEIAQVAEILLRRRQNSPILVGEAGVGKTAIVEGLAQRIVAGHVPHALRDVRICSLDMALLKAGAAVRGEVESRLKTLIADVAASARPVILFIDEAHTLVAGGGGQGDQGDIANLIKPELARGTLRSIGATTWAEYKRYFEKDAALSRRFQPVRVEEPSIEAAQDILQGLAPSLQAHHKVYVTQSAIAAAVRLSSRYIAGRQLPDKAISVLDTACARVVAARNDPDAVSASRAERERLLALRVEALQRERTWTSQGSQALGAARDALTSLQDEKRRSAAMCASPASSILPSQEVADPGPGETAQRPLLLVAEEDVAGVIADWTGVPSQKMLADQYSLVSRLEETLARRIVGQPDACQTICDRLRAFAAKLEDPSRPIGVFLLVGPSGVGKTETAHALAEAFFGKGGITTINMSEYQEAHSVSKLKGAPAGYMGFGQGGILTEAIRRRPYGLLLLDEVEKAHQDVLDLFLQVFDKGFMEDSEGVLVDFKNTLVILTSNAADELVSKLGAQRACPTTDDAHAGASAAGDPELQRALLEHFTPAFLGRTQVVPYYPLNSGHLRDIVMLKLGAVCARFEATYLQRVTIAEEVLDMMVARCESSLIGARWIDQFIAQNILSQLSAYVLDHLARQLPVGSVRLSWRAGRVQVDAGQDAGALALPAAEAAQAAQPPVDAAAEPAAASAASVAAEDHCS